MTDKADRPTAKTVETAERTDFVRGAATRAERAGRRLLRRTHSLARQVSQRAARRLPSGSTSIPSQPNDAPITPVSSVPVPVPVPVPATGNEHARADERAALAALAALQARLARAEHATAWLRARLRAERLRRAGAPRLDADALAADLTRDLSRLRTYDAEAVGRVVRRVLSTHGAPVRTAVQARPDRTGAVGATPAAIPDWPRARQEAVAARVLAHAAEVSHPRYVYQALALIAGHGGGTLAHLTRASGLDSAMGKRRLRLAIDALVALGALALRDGIYTLTMEDHPPHTPRGQGAPGVRTDRPRR